METIGHLLFSPFAPIVIFGLYFAICIAVVLIGGLIDFLTGNRTHILDDMCLDIY